MSSKRNEKSKNTAKLSKSSTIFIAYAIILLISIITIFLYCYNNIKYISNNQNKEVKLNGKHIVYLNIKDVKEEYITVDIKVECPKDSIEYIGISAIKPLLVSATRVDVKTRDYEATFEVIDGELLTPNNDSYKINGYTFNDVKFYLPSKMYSFPFGNYEVNFLIELFKSGEKIDLKNIRVTNVSKWLSIKECNQELLYDLSDNNIDEDLKQKVTREFISQGPFKNGVSIMFEYPLTLKILVITISISILLLTIFLQIDIIKQKNVDLTSLGLIITLLLGLPGINSMLKMNIISSLTLIEVATILEFMWLISIPIPVILYKWKNKISK